MEVVFTVIALGLLAAFAVWVMKPVWGIVVKGEPGCGETDCDSDAFEPAFVNTPGGVSTDYSFSIKSEGRDPWSPNLCYGECPRCDACCDVKCQTKTGLQASRPHKGRYVAEETE